MANGKLDRAENFFSFELKAFCAVAKVSCYAEDYKSEKRCNGRKVISFPPDVKFISVLDLRDYSELLSQLTSPAINVHAPRNDI